MKLLLAVTFTSIYALSIRVIFGFLNQVVEIMSLTFLMLVPAIIGYATVRILPFKYVHNRTQAFFWPWAVALLLLVITILLSIEGAICWVMIYPIFAILGGIGGILGYNHKRKGKARRGKDEDLLDSNIDTPSRLEVSLFFIIPVLLGLLEGDTTQTPEEITLSREVVIDSPKDIVWQSILNTDMSGTYLEPGLVYSALDFPPYKETTLDTLAVGGVRMIYYERGLYFEEIIKELETNTRLVLEVNTDPLKIPPTVMDEHILIGGKHLDVLEDSYELEELENGATKLTLSSKFYINTPFNWYSSWWANLILTEILDSELNKVKRIALLKNEKE